MRFTSLENVPGITEDEIKAVEKLRERKSFVFGANLSTEAFYRENGAVGGYVALLCEWLSELFGIRFEPAVYSWSELVAGLESNEIDFSGELTATEERRKIY